MIGVMDSGIGGLAFVRELFSQCAGLEVLYFADTDFFPYGNRSEEEIRRRVSEIAKKLIAKGAGTIVVACNSATAAAVDRLREEVRVPVIGVEPPIKPACQENARVLALVTPVTAQSERFKRLCELYGGGLTVQACPGLAELIERLEGGDLGGALREYFTLVERGFEAIVLGCTHYELVRVELAAIFGDDVRIYAPSTGAVRRLGSLIEFGSGGENRVVLLDPRGGTLATARRILGELAVVSGCDTVIGLYG